MRNPARRRFYIRFTPAAPAKPARPLMVGIASDALGEPEFAAGDDDRRAADLHAFDALS